MMYDNLAPRLSTVDSRGLQRPYDRCSVCALKFESGPATIYYVIKDMYFIMEFCHITCDIPSNAYQYLSKRSEI